MNKKNKGFTLVELLVVIAILAILAAVSVVGYLGFTEKAKESNDESLIIQLNTILQVEEAIDRPNNMLEVEELLFEQGFVYDNITPSKNGNIFAWNKTNNRFVLLDKDYNLSYGDDSFDKVNTYINVNDSNYIDVNQSGYALYFNDKVSDLDLTLSKLTSIDTGTNVLSSLNVLDNNANCEVDIYGDFANDLVIECKNGSINQYANCKNVKINAIANGTYNLHSKVTSVDITYGKLNLSKTSDVQKVNVNEAATTKIVIGVNTEVNPVLINIPANKNVAVYKGENAKEVFVNADDSANVETNGSVNTRKAEVVTFTELSNAVKNSQYIILKEDIMFNPNEIVSIPENVSIVLNLNAKSLTCTNDYVGRPIENLGDLHVFGNGIIDTSMSLNGGSGAINNKNRLIIDDGTFKGAKYASGSVIRNTGNKAELIINDGDFTDATCAIFNEGSAILNDGYYYSTTCSSCNNSIWSYTIRNYNENSFMEINGGEYIGVQGAVSASVGKIIINDGIFKSIKCIDNQSHTATFYALYAAGEAGAVEAIINGGYFETEGNACAAVVGNDNTNGDGGINAKATCIINGGTFVAPEGITALKGAKMTGDPKIYGGIFSYIDNLNQYISDDYEFVKKDNLWHLMLK